MPYKYIIKPRASQKIWSFYRNVARKYQHTFSEEDVISNVKYTVHSIYRIESSLLRRRPTITRWQGFHMAHAGKWYYAYTIDDDVITIHDVCHQQNMHDKPITQ